jgi:hypothetical protein
LVFQKKKEELGGDMQRSARVVKGILREIKRIEDE